MTEYATYYRVSTKGQEESGLGLAAQKSAITQFCKSNGGIVVKEFKETESGKRINRPELLKALDFCKNTGATLLIAKLDRLARNAAFILNLQDSGVKFKACDNPGANEMVVGILAIVAQAEAKSISERTKAALDEVRKSGSKSGKPIGRPKGYTLKSASKQKISAARRATAKRPSDEAINTVKRLHKAGSSFAEIAKELNELGSTTPNGGQFSAAQARKLLLRWGELKNPASEMSKKLGE